jgi:hypothetical protein
MPEPDPRESLAQQDPEFRVLLEQHREFEHRLSELLRKVFLSDEERIEQINIKKQKLRLKDRMEELIRERTRPQETR